MVIHQIILEPNKWFDPEPLAINLSKCHNLLKLTSNLDVKKEVYVSYKFKNLALDKVPIENTFKVHSEKDYEIYAECENNLVNLVMILY